MRDMELEYHTLDVFTELPFGGNQLAVFPDAPDLPPATMQAIARELSLSETVFVRPATRAGAVRQLRIFTPRVELPFAGHPTIGTAQLLVELGVVPVVDGGARFVLEEAVGLIPVEVTATDGGRFFAWLTTAQLPERGPEPPSSALLGSVLGLPVEDILATAGDAPRAYSVGVPFLYVPLRDRAALSRVQVDVARWREVLSGHWAPHLYVFAPDGGGVDDRRLAARMFAPAMGIAEDPATGAGVAGLAGYLWDRHRAPGRWSIAQGREMGRPSELHVEMIADGGTLRAVRVGGASVRIGRGVLRTR